MHADELALGARDASDVPDDALARRAARSLGPGCYLVEGALARPAPYAVVEKAMRALGWGGEDGRDLIVDESERKDASTRFRFVARLHQPLEATDSAVLTYARLHKLTLDPFEEIREEGPAARLFRGETSEYRILSRLGRREVQRLARDVVLELLGEFRGRGPDGQPSNAFHVEALTLLRPNLRLQGQPGTRNLWLAVLRWDGPDSIMTIQEPLHFEDWSPVAAAAAAPPTDASTPSGPDGALDGLDAPPLGATGS